MRRSSILLLVALALGGGACGSDAAHGPTLTTIDFSPTAELVVDEDGISCAMQGVSSACHLQAGEVVEVANRGAADHRLQADRGRVFDTGVMQPGDRTTIVVSGEGSIEVSDVTSDATLTITVEPAATASGG